MSSKLEVALLVAVILGMSGVLLAEPARAESRPVAEITLYGNAAYGWELNRSNLTKPGSGPTLLVYLGDLVKLTLIGTDNVRHNWFVDYNKNNQTDAGEPTSPDFEGEAGTQYNFTTDRLGTFFYKCVYHYASMKGLIEVRARNAFTLHGHAAYGWGFTNATISSPGPILTVPVGTKVTITLIGNDSVEHNWFVDYDNNTEPGAGEPVSPNFQRPAVVTFNFTADRAGTFWYRCGFHPNTMKGVFVVVGEGGAAPGGIHVALIPGIMFGAIAFVVLFAAAYQVRSVRAARRVK